MTSEILTELKTLSTKIDTLQNEISELHKIFVDHLPVCQGQGLKVSEPQDAHGVRKESSKNFEANSHKSIGNSTISYNETTIDASMGLSHATTNDCRAPIQHKLASGICAIHEKYELATGICTKPERNEQITNICTVNDENEPTTDSATVQKRNEPMTGSFTTSERNEPITDSFTTPEQNEAMTGSFTAPVRNEPKTGSCSVPENGEEQNCEDIDKSTLPKRIPTKENVVHGKITRVSKLNVKECREQCLRTALQQSIVLLVENLPYTEIDILDKLIENECMTETECSDLRNNGSRKDCVRNLVRTIKGRSYQVIKTFLDCVKTLHPDVAASIWQLYEKLIKDKQNYKRQCAFCMLKRSIDLKNLADNIWGVGAISDELYDQIVDGRSNKDTLWTQLATEFNEAPSPVRQKFLRILTAALMRTGQYRELVLKLSKVSELKCACVKMEIEPMTSPFSDYGQTIGPAIIDLDANSTASPRSTESSSRNSTDISEILSDNEDNEYENFFSSQLTADHNGVLHNSSFGLRKGSIHALGYVGVEMRTQRSNSSGKCHMGNFSFFDKRRASMFM